MIRWLYEFNTHSTTFDDVSTIYLQKFWFFIVHLKDLVPYVAFETNGCYVTIYNTSTTSNTYYCNIKYFLPSHTNNMFFKPLDIPRSTTWYSLPHLVNSPYQCPLWHGKKVYVIDVKGTQFLSFEYNPWLYTFVLGVDVHVTISTP